MVTFFWKNPCSKLVEKPKHYLPPEIKDQQAERTLFLGNLPFEMTTKELKKLVKPYGTIEALRFRSVPFKESFVYVLAFIHLV
jgi:RNA recognition motif-containing protein